VEALTLNLSDLRAELTRRMDKIENQVDNLMSIVLAIDGRMPALTKWLDRIDRDNRTLDGTQAAQQKAIDQLAAQVADIQRRLGNLESRT
jgi:ABC-type transporter Mla subunit MlaD